jgi:alpha/beta hydrolase fold
MPTIHFRYSTVEGQRLFYREAGPPAAPAIVLLHGFPASSFLFRGLIPELSGHYHVIAPDHLGFGLSGTPPADEFDYTFDAVFGLDGARAFAADAHRPEIHLLDGVHFLLESQLDAVVGYVRPFLERPCQVRKRQSQERYGMPQQPIIVFDVNETLLDLDTLHLIGAQAAGWQAGLILRQGNAPLDVGPQPDYIGQDLNVVADQLIEKYGSAAGQ